jgi:inorganic triphosphatase YgiF
MEIELKFQLSEASHKLLNSTLRAEGGKSTWLAARYFDTPERDLAKAGISLRLRKENSVWFQTLKSASGAAAAMREEHEIRLGAIRNPHIDLSLYLDTEAGERVVQLLGHSSAADLVCRYTTDVRRLYVRSGIRTCIEYALDSGNISAKPAGQKTPLELTVSELELELKSGPVSGLFTAARKILREHQAWIDVRSKAQRGDALASGTLTVAPTKPASLTLANNSLKALIDAVLVDCTRQVLQNASQIASPEGGEAEHIHQLRVGLRRLRSAIRLFGAYAGDRVLAWESHAKSLASGLGLNRDVDMMAESIWPDLREAGAPLVELPLHETLRTSSELIRDSAVQRWLLALIALEFHGAGDFGDGDWTLVLPAICALHRQCRKGALRFRNLDTGHRHLLRKRLKRLRYALEFIKCELPPKRYRRFSKALVRALDHLGRYNDLQVAMRNYLGYTETDPRAWFAIGWIKAELTKAELRCSKSLLAFRAAEPPWSRLV